MLCFLQKSAPVPREKGVDPELLPEGYTDIQEVQMAVGNDKGIGRRLSAVCKRPTITELNCKTTCHHCQAEDAYSSTLYGSRAVPSGKYVNHAWVRVREFWGRMKRLDLPDVPALKSCYASFLAMLSHKWLWWSGKFNNALDNWPSTCSPRAIYWNCNAQWACHWTRGHILQRNPRSWFSALRFELYETLRHIGVRGKKTFSRSACRLLTSRNPVVIDELRLVTLIRCIVHCLHKYHAFCLQIFETGCLTVSGLLLSAFKCLPSIWYSLK